MLYTQLVSDYVAGMQYEQIPQSVIDYAKSITLHMIGAAICGSRSMRGERLTAYVKACGGIEEAPVWGGDLLVPAEEAAFANAANISISNLEDYSFSGTPCSATVCAALSLAIARRKSGREYLLALIAGLEAGQRIAKAIEPSQEYIASGCGFPSNSWQIMPAALAGAKLLDFDSARVNQTIGAAMYAAFVHADKHEEPGCRSHIHCFTHGNNARSAIVTAQSVESGFDNCYNALDGADGFWHMISDRVDESLYLHGIGERWYTLEPVLKRRPMDIRCERAVDVLSDAVHGRSISAEDVEQVRINGISADPVPYSASTCTAADAENSVAFCIAAFLRGHLDVRCFEELHHDPAILELAEKVCFDCAESSGNPCAVELRLKNGDILRAEGKADAPKAWGFDNECTWFRTMLKDHLDNAAIEGVITKVAGFDREADLQQVEVEAGEKS